MESHYECGIEPSGLISHGVSLYIYIYIYIYKFYPDSVVMLCETCCFEFVLLDGALVLFQIRLTFAFVCREVDAISANGYQVLSYNRKDFCAAELLLLLLLLLSLLFINPLDRSM